MGKKGGVMKQEAYDNQAAGSMDEKRLLDKGEDVERRWRRKERSEHIKKSIQDHVFNRLQDIRR